MSGADLRDANIEGAIFWLADLNNTTIIDHDSVITMLNEAGRASLAQDANLCGARYNAQTRWPASFTIPSCAALVEE